MPKSPPQAETQSRCGSGETLFPGTRSGFHHECLIFKIPMPPCVR